MPPLSTPSSPPPSPWRPAKRVLVVSYSQTGQLASIVARVVAPLAENGRVAVHHEVLRPRRVFPFPWPLLRFFDAFPESATLSPGELETPGLSGDEDFDLVILAYQVWFLAPSQPIVAFLQSPLARRLLAGTPVVTVVACRNMWLQAHRKMRALLDATGARLLDNVVLTDRAPTLATLITTPRWLLTGRRDAFLGLPPAGIARAEIEGAARFGRALRDALAEDRERGVAPLLAGLRAVEVRPELLASETAGNRSFQLWGRLLRLAGPAGATLRRPLLFAYLLFLIAIIVTVVPLSLALQTVLRPLLRGPLARIKTEFELPSGSGSERMARYEV